jgi:hypothetical protein
MGDGLQRAAKPPTAQGISRLLAAAGFERSATLSRASLHHRHTAGFYVRGPGSEVHVRWRPQTPLLTPSAAQAERNRATARARLAELAEAIRAKGYTVKGPAGDGYPRLIVTAGETPAAKGE